MPENLDTFIRSPEEVFASLTADQQADFTDSRLIPVPGNATFVALLIPAHRPIVVKHFEDPSLVSDMVETWERYVANLMIHIGEVIDEDDERLRRIAALLRFEPIGELLKFLAT